MISRLTAFAATFAVFATASLALAASVHQESMVTPTVAKPVPVVQLDTVVVIGKRLPQKAL